MEWIGTNETLKLFGIGKSSNPIKIVWSNLSTIDSFFVEMSIFNFLKTINVVIQRILGNEETFSQEKLVKII